MLSSTQILSLFLKLGRQIVSLSSAGSLLLLLTELLKLLFTSWFPKPRLTPAAALVPWLCLATILEWMLTGRFDIIIL